MNWHYLSIKESLELTASSLNGLRSEDAAFKLQQEGLNELKEKKRKSAGIIFLDQFKDFMILVLIVAAVISGAIGDSTDTFIILSIVLLNALIGFVQEYRAEKAMQELKKIAEIQAEVLRDGTSKKIPSSHLVTGDIVLLKAGNAIPADLRLMEAQGLRIDESALTGESAAIDKISKSLPEEKIPLGERINMAYKGTSVTRGRGRALVVATGMNTELGKIARLLQEDEKATPLQKRMADFGKKISLAVLGICAALFGIGLLRGEDISDMLLLSISLAVAAIPETLPALITIALALGAKRLVKQHALIRKLLAVETLGSVSYICSDKTGTLTLNKMEVLRVHEENKDNRDLPMSPLHLVMILNHDVKRNAEIFSGDPTEIALVEYAIKELGKETYEKINTKLPRLAEIPFDSDRKCMSSIHRFEEKYMLVSKGAVESIAKNLSKSERSETIHIKNEEWAGQGLRVLAFAYKILDSLPETLIPASVEKDLKFAGLAGLIDPPRKEAKTAIAECRSAGIKPVMITGDHPATAVAIAKDIGIVTKKNTVLTGTELQAMSRIEFEDKVEKIAVYARVSPEQKIRIVKALQAKGHFVAMTGDGVNDAPSLKAANIGVAMGINGTDVSKEAAHMILLDDNFATIIKAVKEGRRIYDNIRKFVKYIMTCNGAEIWTILFATLAGLPFPLLPIHILWINLVTDGLPGLALANEKAEPDIMRQPPRKSNESLFAGGIAYHIVWVSLLMAGITLGAQTWALQQNNPHWQTMVFTVLSLSQLGHVLAIRSERTSVFKQGILSNLPLFGAVLLTCLLQVLIIYLPEANSLFKTQGLSMNELLICFGLSSVVFLAAEAEKLIKKGRRTVDKWRGQQPTTYNV